MIAAYLARLEHPGSFVQLKGPDEGPPTSDNPITSDGVTMIEGQRPDGEWRPQSLIFDAERFNLAEVRQELGQYAIDYMEIVPVDGSQWPVRPGMV